ncbi:SdiA-regulated domain-containing protein [Patescibacteria group bacterium]|nr:SdiA-regulated domain-containing protein [Patescibacteria group bacterium]MBU1673890.1 SdiA-regulated domain-containing protein [Patescibacteria group bacterium]MBU1963437.1 SdiA-regulated domain-containing protein [Patescibacteria group bacterium]
MDKKILFIFSALFLLILILPNQTKATAWPGDAGTEIGSNLGVGYEPSGAVWHQGLNHLFMVGDDGDITEMDELGNIIHTWSPGGDMEGIAVADPDSDYIYVGIEHPDAIYEVDISSWPWSFSGKTWSLTTWMTGADNAGLEALTFVPNGDHAYANSSSGGVFYAGLQADGFVYIFDVDLSQSGTVSHKGSFAPLAATVDISGLDYQADTQTLYSIYDSSNKLIETEADGTAINNYDLPGNDQEGVAILPACPDATATIFIAEDVGPEVWKYGSYPININNCPAEDPDPDPEPGPEADPDPEITPEADEYSVRIKGKYLKVFLNGERIAKKKIFRHKQDKIRVKIQDFYEDDRYEIIVTSLFNKKGKIKTYRLTVNNKIKEKKTKQLEFSKIKKKLKLVLKPNKKRFITTFGKKEFKWKIKRKGKFIKI